MPKNNDEQYLDFLRYQEVTVDNTFRKGDRKVSKVDIKYLKSAAKTAAKVRARLDKEDRKRGR